MAVLKRAFILAAGRGTRLRPLTLTTPKPLVPVGGQPNILRMLNQLAEAGVQEVVINLHYLATQIEQAIFTAQMSGYFPELTVHFSYESELLETGGGLKHALPLLGDGPFYTINSDAVWQEDISPMLGRLADGFLPEAMGALLSVVPTGITKSFLDSGDFELSPGGALRFAKDKTTAPYVYCGVQVTTAQLVANNPQQRFSFVEPWRQLADQGKLAGLVYPGSWADMGSLDGLNAANQIVNSQQAPIAKTA